MNHLGNIKKLTCYLERLKDSLFLEAPADLLCEMECNHRDIHVVSDQMDWEKVRVEWNEAQWKKINYNPYCLVTLSKDKEGKHRFVLIAVGSKIFFFDIISLANDKNEVEQVEYRLPDEVIGFFANDATYVLSTSDTDIILKLFPQITNCKCQVVLL